MSIEIKICGRDHNELRDHIGEIAAAFGVTMSVDIATVVETADMTQLFDLVKARFAEQGFNLVAESQADERPKRGRKPKLSPEEAREMLDSSESLEASETYTKDELTALKAATITRIGKHWQDDKGREAMRKILKECCAGYELFRDAPEDLFPAVKNAVDSYEAEEETNG